MDGETGTGGRMSAKKQHAASSKRSSSKYDFVKVRVWRNQQHHFVLSRYLLCRSLECIQIPSVVARTISLELKKTQ